MDLIGKKLQDAINYLENNNIKYEICDNNFSVDGDTTLVINFIAKDEKVILITGSFIFDVENK